MLQLLFLTFLSLVLASPDQSFAMPVTDRSFWRLNIGQLSSINHLKLDLVSDIPPYLNSSFVCALPDPNSIDSHDPVEGTPYLITYSQVTRPDSIGISQLSIKCIIDQSSSCSFIPSPQNGQGGFNTRAPIPGNFALGSTFFNKYPAPLFSIQKRSHPQLNFNTSFVYLYRSEEPSRILGGDYPIIGWESSTGTKFVDDKLWLSFSGPSPPSSFTFGGMESNDFPLPKECPQKPSTN